MTQSCSVGEQRRLSYTVTSRETSGLANPTKKGELDVGGHTYSQALPITVVVEKLGKFLNFVGCITGMKAQWARRPKLTNKLYLLKKCILHSIESRKMPPMAKKPAIFNSLKIFVFKVT